MSDITLATVDEMLAEANGYSPDDMAYIVAEILPACNACCEYVD